MVKDQHHRTRAIAEDGGEISINAKRSAFYSGILHSGGGAPVRHLLPPAAPRQTGIGTELTQIPGIGQQRARELLRSFGSMKAVRQATVEELCAVKGSTARRRRRCINIFIRRKRDGDGHFRRFLCRFGSIR